MGNMRKIRRETIAEKEWGAEFLREMDLVIASNAVESMASGRTLYNRDLDHRIVERCIPFDGEYSEYRLPTINAARGDEPGWKRADAAIAELFPHPRGHWATVEVDGKFDAYMSDGAGGVGTESGYKFTGNSSVSADFNAVTLYAAVLSGIIYDRRNQINNEILAHSFSSADLKPGRLFKDMYVGGKTHGKVEFTAVRHGMYVGGGDAVEVLATRRGARPKTYVIEAQSFVARAGLEIVLPPQYEDAGNAERLIPLFRAPVPEQTPGTIRVGL